MLARRAAAGTPGEGGRSCPPELRTPCLVWDWLHEDEATDVEHSGMNSPFVIRAWRRWVDARRAYAQRAGLNEFVACGPGGRPTLQRSDLR
jgi:hypothetical protein